MVSEANEGLSFLTPYDPAYGTCALCRATLRIYSDTTSAEEISLFLNLKPTRTSRRHKPSNRDPFPNSESEVLYGWFLSTRSIVQSFDLRDHLDWIIAALAPRRDRLLALQKNSHIRMTVCAIWWSKYGGGGPAIWPSQMKALADLNLELGFDVSFFGSEE
jgi:hypothetical protein